MVVMELGGGGTEPVSVAEAKTWCRVERDDEDALIAALVTAAREMVERETGVVLVRRGFRLGLDAVPADRRIRLPRTPLGAVTAVTAYGPDGAPKGFAGTDATPDRSREVLIVSEAVAAAGAGGIEIEFTAGFEAGAVPQAIGLALKRIVAASYEVRGAVAIEMQPGVVPKAARDLIAPFRRVRL